MIMKQQRKLLEENLHGRMLGHFKHINIVLKDNLVLLNYGYLKALIFPIFLLFTFIEINRRKDK